MACKFIRPTIKETIAAIREFGGVTCTWKRETKEYRINFVNGSEDTAYYTEDSSDAIGTARAMVLGQSAPHKIQVFILGEWGDYSPVTMTRDQAIRIVEFGVSNCLPGEMLADIARWRVVPAPPAPPAPRVLEQSERFTITCALQLAAEKYEENARTLRENMPATYERLAEQFDRQAIDARAAYNLIEDSETITLDSYRCTACGRIEAECSANPCDAVIEDRES